LADEIKKNIDNVKIEFIKGSGGVFEVEKDGQLIFSKRKEGRFPIPSEIVTLLSQ
jgi:selT/selW/selH-like putative selenoprotein